jgi:hypothetical protein
LRSLLSLEFFLELCVLNSIFKETSRCPYCAFGFHCKFTGMRSFKSCHSCQIMSFMSNHVILAISSHTSQIMSFMSNHVIHVKSCHSCQIMSFMSNHVIHVKSSHSCQIMSFMSNHVIHVKSCHSCQIMSFMSWVIGLFQQFT